MMANQIIFFTIALVGFIVSSICVSLGVIIFSRKLKRNTEQTKALSEMSSKMKELFETVEVEVCNKLDDKTDQDTEVK